MSAETARTRGYEVTFNAVYATFPCHTCRNLQRVNVQDIDTGKGVRVKCTCGTILSIPPSVWWKTCQNVLVPGWQSKLHEWREPRENLNRAASAHALDLIGLLTECNALYERNRTEPNPRTMLRRSQTVK